MFASKYLAELIEQHAKEASLEVASVFAGRGDDDNAFAWLEKARENNGMGIGSGSWRRWDSPTLNWRQSSSTRHCPNSGQTAGIFPGEITHIDLSEVTAETRSRNYFE